MRSRHDRGFTLIEVMIAVGVLALLAAIAFPNYARYRMKTVRTQGGNCLLNLAKLEEAYYAANNTTTASPNNTYTVTLSAMGLASGNCGELTTSGAPYVVSVAAATASCPIGTCFCATATPQDAQAGDGVLTLKIDSSKLDPGSRQVKVRYPVKSGSTGTICEVSTSNVESASGWTDVSASGL